MGLWALRVRRRLVVVAVLSSLVVVPTLGLTATPAFGAAGRTPHCPPDCGALAAGDPLLIPYVIDNPGPNWSVLPAGDVQSYVTALKRGIVRVNRKGSVTNVAAGKWVWNGGGYSLMIVLVSSSSLAGPHLQNAVLNAQDLCEASRLEPGGRLIAVARIPHSVSGVCAGRSGSTSQVATVVAFDRGNVATLMEFTSDTGRVIDQSFVTLAAQQQFLALPPGGVLVSQGGDIELLLIWLALVAAVIACVVACIRRRGSWRGPIEAVVEGFRQRKLALGVSVVAVVGAMAFAMFQSALIHGFGRWYESGFNDFWRTWVTSYEMTFGGGYAHIYALNTALETAPTVQVLLAPIARLASGLSFPDPGDVLYPAAFWVAGPILLSAMALPLCAADRYMQYMGVTDLRRRLTVLGVMAVILPPITLDGHPEDLIALGASLYGLIAALEGRHRAVGWWFGVALAFQFLAILAVPMALIFVARRQWLRTILPMIGIPLAVLIVPLIGAGSTTVRQLVHQKVYDSFGYITPTWNFDPGVASLIRGLVALAAVPAAIVVARTLPESRRAAANLVLWTLGVLFTLRVAEPELVPYFLAPALALMTISASRTPWWRLVATGALAVWLTWWLHFAIEARWSAWLILVGQLAVLLWLGWPGKEPLVEKIPVVSKKKPDRTPATSRR
jgi:hypothetical protein